MLRRHNLDKVLVGVVARVRHTRVVDVGEGAKGPARLRHERVVDRIAQRQLMDDVPDVWHNPARCLLPVCANVKVAWHA